MRCDLHASFHLPEEFVGVASKFNDWLARPRRTRTIASWCERQRGDGSTCSIVRVARRFAGGRRPITLRPTAAACLETPTPTSGVFQETITIGDNRLLSAAPSWMESSRLARRSPRDEDDTHERTLRSQYVGTFCPARAVGGDSVPGIGRARSSGRPDPGCWRSTDDVGPSGGRDGAPSTNARTVQSQHEPSSQGRTEHSPASFSCGLRRAAVWTRVRLVHGHETHRPAERESDHCDARLTTLVDLVLQSAGIDCGSSTMKSWCWTGPTYRSTQRLSARARHTPGAPSSVGVEKLDHRGQFVERRQPRRPEHDLDLREASRTGRHAARRRSPPPSREGASRAPRRRPSPTSARPRCRPTSRSSRDPDRPQRTSPRAPTAPARTPRRRFPPPRTSSRCRHGGQPGGASSGPWHRS